MTRNNSKNKISSKEKFIIVMETYTLSEFELSRYFRENGLYVEEVKQWRSSCLAANDGFKNSNNDNLEEELKEEKKKSKELAKDLRKKEKALAETAALLVLRKKLDKLSKQERQSVLNIVNKPKYSDLPPSQIVPALADRGIYIASESTFYRILREENMQHHRRKTKKPEKSKVPTTFIADAPNQVWTWDITWLNAYNRGIYYKLYMIIDIFSRKIVSCEVWNEENGELAADLVERAVLSEKIKGKPLVLHSDNGAPMKSHTLKSKLEFLGVLSSYSRPRVSNDNPFSEAQFKTLKYRPDYPKDGFKSIDKAREWVSNFVNWYNTEHYHSGIDFSIYITCCEFPSISSGIVEPKISLPALCESDSPQIIDLDSLLFSLRYLSVLVIFDFKIFQCMKKD
ncbi:MAG: IS3 family transposase [Clostridium sp.]